MTAISKNKVLIIEDDDHVSKVYDIKLKMEGIDTFIARDGEEGVKVCITEKPDLVLLDLMLPKKDGFEVLEELKKDSSGCKHVPVIILSNLGQQSDREKAEKLGATEYLVKADIRISDIIEKVKSYLNK